MRTPRDAPIAQVDVKKTAMKAAGQMVRLLENLLEAGRVQHCPMHIVPALFVAMDTLVTQLKIGDRISKQLAYVRIKTCIIVLRELQSLWPICHWMVSHFVKIIEAINGEDSL